MKAFRFLESLALIAGVSTAAPAAPAATVASPRTVASEAAVQLERGYVFPSRALEAGAMLRAHANAGAYDGLTGADLGRRLTLDLLAVLHDKHVRVNYSDEILPPDDADAGASGPGNDPEAAAFERALGFGLGRVAHLPGNVGYIDLRLFAGTVPQRDRVIDAMADAVATSDAVILDLRRNHGGDPDAVSRLLSHFLPPKTHLNDFVGRGDGDPKIESSTFTQALALPPMTAPLYVLTSGQTFSAGEECAYDLQALGRATLVGESTGGGANPGEEHRLDPHYAMFVPFARARNPITHTNWEGTGVVPAVAVPADRALATAYAMFLNRAATAPHPLIMMAGPGVRGAPPSSTQMRQRLPTMTDGEILDL